MRIRIKAKAGWIPAGLRETSLDGRPTLNGIAPSWCDVEVFDDHDQPITNVKSVTLHLSDADPFDPVTATLEVYVDAIDIDVDSATIAEVPA